MQSPETPANGAKPESQTEIAKPNKTKEIRWPKILANLLSSGYLKPVIHKKLPSVVDVGLSISFSIVCMLCWLSSSNHSSQPMNIIFHVSQIVFLILSLLKSSNPTISKIDLKPFLSSSTGILKGFLIGALFLSAENQRIAVVLAINLVSGIEILSVNSILCRIVVTTIQVASVQDEPLAIMAVLLTNLDILFQIGWFILLIRRQSATRSSSLPPMQQANKRKSKLLGLKSPNKFTASETKIKEVFYNRYLQSENPKYQVKKVPRSHPRDNAHKYHSQWDLKEYQESHLIGQKEEYYSSSRTPEIEVENVSEEIEYKMNIPVQQTTSFRRAHIIQTDPEAETVKGKKCSDSRNISPRSGRSMRKKSPKPQILSCQRLDKDYIVKRARSITPPNTNSDFQRSRRKFSPSMVPVSPKTKWQMSPGLLGTPTLPMGASQTPDYLKSRVFAEYFEMIDDLVLIADRWLSVIANNFNNNVEARTIKPASTYFDQTMLQQKSARMSLDAYFKPPKSLEQTGMQCSDQTLSSLNVIFEAFNYRHTRISDRERYEKLKISNILDQLEQTFFQQQRQVRHKGKSSGGDKLWSVSSGPVSKGLTGLFSCKYGISEVLFLIKEYLRVIEGKTLKYHFSNTLIFTFFLQGNVQLKIRLVSVDGTYYILLMAENVSEKVELVEVNSKLNYSYMLMKSLSHELKTPVHHVMQVLKELEFLLEVRAASDPQLLKSVQKFEQIAGGLDITVGNILDYASILNKTIQLKKTQFAVKPFLEELVCCFLEKCNLKKIGLQVDCDPELIMNTDYDRLKGVLFIFLDNSVKFTQKGGINLRAQLVARKIYFKVIDSGNGIKQRDLDAISKILSDPFSETTTKDAAGLGFGMRVASNILRLLQTKKTDLLAIDSKLDQGTTIQFEISQGIVESDQMLTSSISSQESYLPKRSKDDMISQLKFEDKKVEFMNDRLNFRASSNQLEKFHSHKATLSLDSSKPHVASVTERSKARPPIQSRLGPGNKLTKDVIKRKGFVRGIGNRTLMSLDLAGFSRSLSPNKPIDSSEGMPVYPSKPIKTLKLLSSQPETRRLDSPLQNPREDGISQPALAADESSQQLDPHKPKVLIVDDEIINLEFGKQALKRIGFFVYSASMGEEAVRIIEKLLIDNISLDVVLMDYNMPKLRGDEVVRILLQEKYKPVVGKASIFGLTAQTDDKTVQDCLLAGMHKVFAKPFDFFENKALLRNDIDT